MTPFSLSIQDFLIQNHFSDYRVTQIAPDASDRQYYRLTSKKNSLILMDSSKDIESLHRFIQVSQLLSQYGFSAPILYQSDLNNGYLILEDLGQQTINQFLANQPQQFEKIFYSIIEFISALSHLVKPALPPFDRDFFFSELNAFTTWYLPYIGLKPIAEDLNQFTASWDKPLKYLHQYDPSQVFVHKDLHTANLFWLPQRNGIQKIGVIDYQNAKKGSIAYDFVSIVNSSRFPLAPAFRQKLLNQFLSLNHLDADHFRNLQDIFLAQRSIKILGNFSGIYQRKNDPRYLPQLPHVWKQVQQSFQNPLLSDVQHWFIQRRIHL